jgi:hypothetical protein
MVIGADNPRVAVYENGQVIRAKPTAERMTYRTFVLDAAGLARVRDAMKPVLALKDLKPGYSLSDVTDQPTAMLYLREGEREVATSVYGLDVGDVIPSAAGARADCPPRDVRDLHAWLSKLDDAHSEEWVPTYVEVMLWDYSYAPDESIHWPEDWPGLDSERAVKRGDSWSIFLDSSQLPRLRELLATCKQKGALEIEGKKMAVSFRYTFPGEPAWRAAFARPEPAPPAQDH